MFVFEVNLAPLVYALAAVACIGWSLTARRLLRARDERHALDLRLATLAAENLAMTREVGRLSDDLGEQRRIAGIAIDQVAAKVGVFSEPTFSSRPNQAAKRTGAQAGLPRLFGALAISELTRRPGQDAQRAGEEQSD